MLYHGTTTEGLKTLKPFPHPAVNGESCVFATSDIRFALAMIYASSNELAVGYYVDQENGAVEMHIDELVPDSLDLLSAPGIIYEVADIGFISDSRLSRVELIS